MAKSQAKKPAEKKIFSAVLEKLEADRKASGLTLTNDQLEFIVKLVKASE